MSNPKLRASRQPERFEEIGKIWNWAIFVIQMLGRLGGIKAWIRTFERLSRLLISRFIAQHQDKSTVEVSPEVRQSFYPATKFAFAELLEANWQTIFAELAQLQGKYFIPWSEKFLYKDGWTTFALYTYGLKIEKNCNLCPETTKLLERVPNLMTAVFSSLAPGTQIAPHTGYPDGVLRCHLGLVVPAEGCGIRIGDEIQTWSTGKCLIFDDTIEHEAWNLSDELRAVLLIDFKPEIGLDL
jgi:ornithine lipid ester-linked acyl 2-hydroxylase